MLKWLTGFVALGLAGCASPGEGGSAATREAKPDRGTIVTPAAMRTEGKVVRTNEKLNFVVLDFGFKRLPRPGQQLGVYRLGKKTGQVRVSGPAWETYTVADIVEGEIWVGDEAKLR
ncbi:MAG: hypothetical protein CBC62_06920 [Opitutia bacterium TMED102]|nr:hypothetical protein [Verrucomicrobiales bacterium]OUV37976.1 MAG: hypothetical protein CBC62_06920 [Opitutae bacterium TMED102]